MSDPVKQECQCRAVRDCQEIQGPHYHDDDCFTVQHVGEWAKAEELRDELAALKHTVIDTIGGVDYEGFPTCELNYLQRLRILVAMEAALKKLVKYATQLGRPWVDGNITPKQWDEAWDALDEAKRLLGEPK